MHYFKVEFTVTIYIIFKWTRYLVLLFRVYRINSVFPRIYWVWNRSALFHV